MNLKKTKISLIVIVLTSTIFLNTALVFTLNDNQDTSRVIDKPESESLSFLPTQPNEPKERQSPNTSGSSLDNRINFNMNGQENINVPFNVDVWDTYLHADTAIDIDWAIDLPFDINVEYADSYKRGEAQNLDMELEIPDNQACLQINTTTNFNMEWDVPGVDDGSVSVPDYEYDTEKYFTTPLGPYNLPFNAKFGIPVSISGVPIGTLYIIATPQIIASVKAQLQNSNFLEVLALEWEEEGIESKTLTARPDSTPGDYTIEIGDFKYAISLGIECSIEFKFTEPFDIINTVLDKLGYPLELVLGTWPKIEVHTLSSSNTIDFTTDISSENVTGNTYGEAIGFGVKDWTTPHTVSLSGTNIGERKFYQFQALKAHTYDFKMITGSSSVNAYIYDASQSEIINSNSEGLADELSFTANEDDNYYLVFEKDAAVSSIDVLFEDVHWPGKNSTYAKPITIPYSGDYDQLDEESSSVWYKFDAEQGDEVSFWLYKHNSSSDFKLHLYSDPSGLPDTTSSSENEFEVFNEDSLSAGTWYVEVTGSDIGYYDLDCGYSVDGIGSSGADPKSFDSSSVDGYLRGTELDTKGGVWYSVNCEKKKEYSFNFDGDSSALYDFALIDSDASTVISRKTFSGTALKLDYKCNSDGIKYIHILPYKGGVNYSVSKSEQSFDYVGESSQAAQPFNEHFPLESDLPTGWGGSTHWDEIKLEEDTKLLMKLDYDSSNNFDLYLYDQEGSEVLESSYQRNPEIIAYDIRKSGNYKVLVDRIEGSGQYTLTAAPAHKLDVGQISGKFSSQNINVYHYVHLKKGETLDIDLEASGYRAPYFGVYLYDGDFTELGKDDEGPQLALEYTAEEEGDYYIRFYNSEMGNGEFSGTIDVKPPDITVILTILAVVLIPLVIGLTFMATSYRYKKHHGEWFWKDPEFKDKLHTFKFNSKRKLRKVRKGVSEKFDDFKNKSASSLKNVKRNVSRKIDGLKSDSFPMEDTYDDFEWSEERESHQSDDVVQFEKKEQLSDKELEKLKDLVDVEDEDL